MWLRWSHLVKYVYMTIWQFCLTWTSLHYLYALFPKTDKVIDKPCITFRDVSFFPCSANMLKMSAASADVSCMLTVLLLQLLQTVIWKQSRDFVLHGPSSCSLRPSLYLAVETNHRDLAWFLRSCSLYLLTNCSLNCRFTATLTA